eukprot:5719375-Pyramimonas_sp.AAC.1
MDENTKTARYVGHRMGDRYKFSSSSQTSVATFLLRKTQKQPRALARVGALGTATHIRKRC